VGTQHLIEEDDLLAVETDVRVPLPDGWDVTITGEPMPDWAALVRRSRAGR